MNEDGELLWQQGLFQGEAQMGLKMIEQQRYQKHGRLVPEMPTDNGVLLRKAILLDDCIKDLVRPFAMPVGTSRSENQMRAPSIRGERLRIVSGSRLRSI